MSRTAADTLKPRKSPRQARSAATVDAIHEATVQVLLAEGVARLNTTRVAERAGVSVGTMYQYYQHKEALLFAVVQRQLAGVRVAMEQIATVLSGRPLAEIADGLALTWLAAKTEDIAASRAIYGIAAEFDIVAMTRQESDHIVRAVERALASAADQVPDRIGATAFTLLAVMGGAVRVVLERGAGDAELAILRAELPVLCRQYLLGSVRPRTG